MTFNPGAKVGGNKRHSAANRYSVLNIPTHYFLFYFVFFSSLKKVPTFLRKMIGNNTKKYGGVWVGRATG